MPCDRFYLIKECLRKLDNFQFVLLYFYVTARNIIKISVLLLKLCLFLNFEVNKSLKIYCSSKDIGILISFVVVTSGDKRKLHICVVLQSISVLFVTENP